MHILRVLDRQLALISRATEVCARLHYHQTDVLRDFAPLSHHELMEIKNIIDNGSGVQLMDEELAKDESDCLYDIHQVCRHHLAWMKEDNDPSTRRWPEQMQVCYDKPFRTGSEELVRIEYDE